VDSPVNCNFFFTRQLIPVIYVKKSVVDNIGPRGQYFQLSSYIRVSFVLNRTIFLFVVLYFQITDTTQFLTELQPSKFYNSVILFPFNFWGDSIGRNKIMMEPALLFFRLQKLSVWNNRASFFFCFNRLLKLLVFH
jgi:hypothetical protein